MSTKEVIGRVGGDLEWALQEAIVAALTEDLDLGDVLKELATLWREQDA